MGLLSSLFGRKKQFRHDALVWETNALTKSSLVPLSNEFPEFDDLTLPNSMNAWDILVTVAMTGVAAKTQGHLDNSASVKELRDEIGSAVKSGDILFDDYLNYSLAQSERVQAPWSAISAMWVVENLKHMPKISAELKAFLNDLKAVNILSSYMNMSYGTIEPGFTHFMNEMCLTIEKDTGVDMGFGTSGTTKDTQKKMVLLADVFDTFAKNTAKLIKEKIK